MNRVEEERLVAMYFDNSNFEKGAQETIKTLDKLKESMNLEDSVKGFDMFDKMKRNAGMEQMQKSAEKLKNTFGSIGTILTKSFSVMTGPLKTLEHAFQTLSGYVGKYLGFDLASKIIGSVESAVRGLTVAPVSEGWKQYENEVDSVRTIMSSTGRSIQDVTHQMDILTQYADQTVYSLSDMTSNIGKFTNNGVKLEDATQAMMGIANAAADAGQGTQQASMAMYNFSQAIGVGKMTSIDWKSIENANMATVKLKGTFMELAAAKGELKKIEKDGVTKYFYTKDSKGQEIKDQKKWTEVTTSNFRDTLSKGWLTGDAMVAALRIYSGENISLNELIAMGIEDEETQQKLLKVGEEAMAAAKQVRTFSKMMGALKDSAASGWSRTFTLLFGNAEEATELWTKLSEKIGGMLDSSSAHRNKILKDWKETREVLGSEWVDSGSSVGKVEKIIYGRNGREILIDSLYNLLHIAGQLKDAFSQAFGDVFGSITGSDLFEKTQSFEQTTLRIKEYFGELNDQGSRMNKIYRIIRGIVSAFSLWKKSIKSLIDTVVRIFFPSFDGVTDILATIGDFFYELNRMEPGEIFAKIGEKIKEVWGKIKKFFTLDGLFNGASFNNMGELPAVKWLKSAYEKIKETVSGFSINIGLGSVGDWLSGAWGTVLEIWEKIEGGAKEALSGLGEFLSNTGSWIKEKLDLKDEDVNAAKTTVANVYTGASNWIKGVWEGLKDAYNTTLGAAKDILPELGKFFSSPWEWIKEQFSDTEAGTIVDPFADLAGSVAEGAFDFNNLGIVGWINGIWDVVASFFGDDLPDAVVAVKDLIVEFFTAPWDWIQKHILSGDAKVFVDNLLSGNEDQLGIVSWLSGIFAEVERIWVDVIEPTASSALTAIGDFFSTPVQWLIGIFTPEEETDEIPIISWASGVLSTIENFWNDTVQPAASTAFTWLYNFFATPVQWLIDLFTPDYTGDVPILTWFGSVLKDIENFWNDTVQPAASTAFTWIEKFFSTPIQWLIDLFTPDYTGDVPILTWFGSVLEDIENFWNTTVQPAASTAFTWLGEFFKTPINWLIGIFTPEEDGEIPIVTWASGVLSTIENFWTGTIEPNAKAALSAIGKFLETPIAWIKNVTGYNESLAKADINGKLPLVQWIEDIADKISNAWQGFITDPTVRAIITSVGEFLSNVWGWVSKLFKEITGTGSSEDEASESMSESSETMEDVAEVGEDLTENSDEAVSIFSTVIDILGGFLEKAKEFIGQVVNWDSVEKLFNGVGTFLSGAFSALGDILSAVGKYVQGDQITWNEFATVCRVLGLVLLPAIGSLALQIAGGLAAKSLGIQLASVGAEIRDLGIGIGILVAAIIGIKTFGVTEDDLLKYGGLLLAAGAILAAIASLFAIVKGKFSKESGGGGDDESSPWGDLGQSLIKTIEKIGIIAVVLALLPNVLEAAADAKSKLGDISYGEDLLYSVLGIFAGVAAMAVVIGLIGKLNVPLGASQTAALVVLEAVAIVLGTLWAVNQIFPNVSDAQAVAEKAKSIGEAIGGLVGGLIGAIGEGIGSMIGAVGEGIGDAKYAIENGETRQEQAEREKAELEFAVDQFIRIGTILTPDNMEALDGMVSSIGDLSQYTNLINGDNFNAFAQGFSSLIWTVYTLLQSLAGDYFKGLDGIPGTLDGVKTNADNTIYMLDILADDRFKEALEKLIGLTGDILETFGVRLEGFKTDRFQSLSRELSKLASGVEFGMVVDGIIKVYKAIDRNFSGNADIQEIVGKYDEYQKNLDMLTSVINMLEMMDSFYKKYSQVVTKISAIKITADEMRGDPTHKYDNSLRAYGKGFLGLDYNDRPVFDYQQGADKFVPNVMSEDVIAQVDQFLTDVEKLYQKINEHTGIEELSATPVAEALEATMNLFTLFGENKNVDSWRRNFEAFSELVEDNSFMDKYVESVESVYERLQNSTLANSEGITFDGIKIVSKLFEAIKEGFDDTTNIPSINAQPIIDQIVLAISNGKEDLVAAIHNMIQAGIDMSADADPTEYNTNGIDVSDNINKVIELIGSVGVGGAGFSASDLLNNMGLGEISSILDSDEFTSAIDGIKEKIPSLDELITFKDANGEKVDIMSYMQTQIQTIQSALDNTDPVKITIQPTFDLTQLDPLNLQKQLSSTVYKIPATMTLPEMNVNYENLRTELEIEAIKQKLDTIAMKIESWGSQNLVGTNNLGSHMDGVANRIAGMRIYMDGDTLVGYLLPSIDRGLGERAARWSRTGTVFEYSR